MENRRQHYRFSFAPTRRLPIRLSATSGGTVVTGKIVNLSIWGVCVSIEGSQMPAGDKWQAIFSLEPGEPALSIPMERVYGQDGKEACYGFRFLPTASPRDQEEREGVLWRYLLEEQRRERRAARQTVGVMYPA